tara:strand:- start:17 stop:580 length:564 start_codon:yes stop_codon:yes gene_type:complete
MSDFDLRKFFKNQYLKEAELPKGQWVDLNDKETENQKNTIFDLISNAYAQIGGHPNYTSPDNVTGSEGDADYVVIDVDDDSEIDAVSVSKEKPAGTKYVATGHDGSSPAKRAMINYKVNNLKSPGYYIEVSGKIKDILIAKGVPVITDKETIERVMKGKKIEINDDGSYERYIGGQKHTKVLLGNPL